MTTIAVIPKGRRSFMRAPLRLASKAIASFRELAARRREARALNANWRSLEIEYPEVLDEMNRSASPKTFGSPFLPPLAVVGCLFTHKRNP
jgi:hypothetical protein